MFLLSRHFLRAEKMKTFKHTTEVLEPEAELGLGTLRTSRQPRHGAGSLVDLEYGMFNHLFNPAVGKS